jgi:hypothetical protein
VLSTCQENNFSFLLTTANLANSAGLGKTIDPTGIRTLVNGTKIRCPSPLDDRAKKQAKAEGIEPSSTVLETVILPLNYANVNHNSNVSLRTHGVGFEPTSDKLTVWGITIMLPVFIIPGLRFERRKTDPKSVVIPFHHPGISPQRELNPHPMITNQL